MLPGDFPPWPAVRQQGERWLAAGCFETLAHDLRALLRHLLERHPRPSAVVLMVAPCQARQRAEREPVTMVTSAKRAARFTSPWTLWATCWP